MSLTAFARTEEEKLLESWLDGEVGCHWNDCTAAATWRGRLKCGHSYTYCDRHKRQFDRVAWFRCDACTARTETDNIAWSRL